MKNKPTRWNVFTWLLGGGGGNGGASS